MGQVLQDGEWHHVLLTGRVKDTLADGSRFWLEDDGVTNKRSLTTELKLFVDFDLVASEFYDSQWFDVTRAETPGTFFTDCAGAMQQTQVLTSPQRVKETAKSGAGYVQLGQGVTSFEFTGFQIPRTAIVMSAELLIKPVVRQATSGSGAAFELSSECMPRCGSATVDLDIAVSAEATCGNGIRNRSNISESAKRPDSWAKSVRWSVDRKSWEYAGLQALCLQRPCPAVEPMRTPDLTALVQAIVSAGASESIVVEVLGQGATCDDTAGGRGSRQEGGGTGRDQEAEAESRGSRMNRQDGMAAEPELDPLYTYDFFDSLNAKVALPRLRVRYCLNAACVSPRWLGSHPLSVVPKLVDGRWIYGRRLATSQLGTSLVFGPALYFGVRSLAAPADERLLRQTYYRNYAMLQNVQHRCLFQVI